MGAVKSFAMDMEEQFFGAAQDIVHECADYEEFCHIMDDHKDLVSHMGDFEVNQVLTEIYYG